VWDGAWCNIYEYFLFSHILVFSFYRKIKFEVPFALLLLLLSVNVSFIKIIVCLCFPFLIFNFFQYL
jgi:hypothetical protein